MKKELDEKVEAPVVETPVVEEEVTEEEVAGTIEKMVATAVEKVQAENVKAFEAYKAEQKELATKRAGLYNPEVKSDRKEANENLRKFITALTMNDVATLKDLTEGTPASGGYLVDTELVAEIQHLMTEYGVARREMFLTPVTKGSTNLNNLATDISVYWTTETTAKTSSDVTLGQVELVIKKLAVIVPMSDEVLEDSEIDLLGFLSGRIAEKFSQAEDTQFFNGSGSPFTGLLQNSNVNEIIMTGTTFASIDADDLIDMVDATPQGALANGKYYMNRTILSYIRKLKDDNGMYIYQAPSVQGPATCWGYPVVLVEAMPAKTANAVDTSFVLFGDLKKCAWVGYKGGLRAKISDQATVRNTADDDDIDLFRQDMTALRLVERVGYVVVIPTAVTKLTTASASA